MSSVMYDHTLKVQEVKGQGRWSLSFLAHCILSHFAEVPVEFPRATQPLPWTTLTALQQRIMAAHYIFQSIQCQELRKRVNITDEAEPTLSSAGEVLQTSRHDQCQRLGDKIETLSCCNFSPSHCVRFVEYPDRHSQRKEPIIFLHVDVFSLHAGLSWPGRHSSISMPQQRRRR